MKYNRAFIAAVHHAAGLEGETAAEAIFNKLFDVSSETSALSDLRDPYELLAELNQKVAGYVYLSDIKYTVEKVGRPGYQGVGGVAWIKVFREHSQLGLKDSKDTYDFVRDNPRILD